MHTLSNASEELFEQATAFDQLAQSVAFGKAGFDQVVERVDNDLDAIRVRVSVRLVVDDAALNGGDFRLFLLSFRAVKKFSNVQAIFK